jgi:bifunctional DNase/RNase
MKDEPTTAQMVKVLVAGITMDPSNNTPVVLLKQADSNMAIPIWIGLVEASAIATELEGTRLARPMTHDLLKTVLLTLGGALERVEVTELRDNTFYANLIMQGGDGATHRVDSRPSDAIALALRLGADIFVARSVIEATQMVDLSQIRSADEGEKGDGPDGDKKPGGEASKDKWTQILENLKPEDFGKYKM